MKPTYYDDNGNTIINFRRLPSMWIFHLNYFEYCGRIIKSRYVGFQTKEYIESLPNSLVIEKKKYAILQEYDDSYNFLKDMKYVLIYDEEG